MHLLGTHHIAIFTPNFEALEAFYTRTLGFPVTRRWDDAGIIFIDIGSTKVELIRKDSAGGTSGPHALDEGVGINHIALHVADTDAAFQEWASAGVKVLREPSDFKTVRIAFFSDPDGNVLELVEELG
jgi:catechol 2,3-dioxygenase-like lactoylglutathione lyase family enzyme